MKRVFDECLKILIYTVFGIVLIGSSYLIIVNVHHYQALSSKIVVSEADIEYINYKNNINSIEEYLKNDTSNKQELITIGSALNVLKNGGVFRLIPNTKMEYYDLYTLNSYFLNDIINGNWIANLKALNKDQNIDKTVNILIDNAEYLNKHFIDNSSTLYEGINQDRLKDDYKKILNNYLSFSNVILSMTKDLGGE